MPADTPNSGSADAARATTERCFGRVGALVGMVHVHALPGTPRHAESIDAIVDAAVADARALADAGFDAIAIENMHDRPYLRREVGPEIVAGMTAVATAVRAAVDLPLGIQVLAGANRAALAIAHATGLSFVRAEGALFASVADEGVLDEADAGPLLRYRRAIGADGIAIFADIRKKHASHAITADVSIGEHAEAASFVGLDGVIVTGTATGAPTDLDDLDRARAGGLPVVVGSGATAGSVRTLLAHADAVIVGSSIKVDGDWTRAVDPDRARAFVAAAR